MKKQSGEKSKSGRSTRSSNGPPKYTDEDEILYLDPGKDLLADKLIDKSKSGRFASHSDGPPGYIVDDVVYLDSGKDRLSVKYKSCQCTAFQDLSSC